MQVLDAMDQSANLYSLFQFVGTIVENDKVSCTDPFLVKLLVRSILFVDVCEYQMILASGSLLRKELRWSYKSNIQI